ncbi:peptide-methionine (S)-S-oxide reductase MsrA [Halobacillus sp. BBL2006]|uniref:peptide-methionine (S)-S-oxide reductase MsrA n=1 Tax=Halobacillus sp. BBL2006 TaxID=1543706 RepID=UPI00054223B9|nr:peptide-methionine (S)-S-oxide reductase MsrA [Halobacillus sp. BBL2006]KHE66945.1 peptide methionine sulfoxide reductase [Halobacillus sp. BBL2006]
MSKRLKWSILAGALLLIGVFVIPEAYAYLTKRNYESVAVTDKDIPEGSKVATFAGGCFWCMEPPFEKLEGISEVVSGYTGGDTKNPTFEEVSAGGTGHVEAVQVYYNPEKITYEQLLEVFWRQINPTDNDGQFVDRGYQYTTAIYYHSEQQRKLAEQSKQALANTGRFEKEIVTRIEKAEEFYRAEEYHQDYYKKNELRYKFYRGNSGRDDYLEKTWGEDRKLNLPEK